MFEFTADELAFLRDTRSTTRDHEGREVLVGLTFEETETFMTRRRKFLLGQQDRENRKASIALGKKHQQARLEALGTEILRTKKSRRR